MSRGTKKSVSRSPDKAGIKAESPKPFDFTLEIPATLTVIVRNEAVGGYSAEVPALPGCITEGDTLEELRENLKEATDGWLKASHDLAVAEMYRELSQRA